MSKQKHQAILIVDFGSQVTQLIARRLRELNVYCEIHPYSSAADVLKNLQPKGIILSGGPASVLDKDAPAIAPQLLDEGVPILGICYGQQALCVALGGKVEAGHNREFGRADVSPQKSCSLFDGVWETEGNYQVWMSHGDRCSKLPEGFEIVATSLPLPPARPWRLSQMKKDVFGQRSFIQKFITHRTEAGCSRISSKKLRDAPVIGPWPPIASRPLKKSKNRLVQIG